MKINRIETSSRCSRDIDSLRSSEEPMPPARAHRERVKALRAPLPVKLIPAGGAGLEQVPEYLGAGAFALGIGSSLLGDATAGGSQADRSERAAAFIAAAAPSGSYRP